MGCPCKKEWFFVDAEGVEHVAASNYQAVKLRRQLGVPNAPIRSREKQRKGAAR